MKSKVEDVMHTRQKFLSEAVISITRVVGRVALGPQPGMTCFFSVSNGSVVHTGDLHSQMSPGIRKILL